MGPEAALGSRRGGRGLAAWLVVGLLVAAGTWALEPPRPVPASAPADRFSAERALEHVRVIAREPHPMGTAAIAEVRTYIRSQLEGLGIPAEVQAISAPNYYGRGEPVPVVNVFGRIPGTATTNAVVLMAHYDTVPATSGANDNSAAVATLLETGRALLAGPALRNDVVLLFTDGEEPAPHYGVAAFVADQPLVETAGLVVNLEASGGSGASLLAETSGPERWLIDGLAATPRPAAFSFLTETTGLMGDIGTDFDVWRNAGFAGFHFAYVRGSPIYHTPADRIDAVNAGSVQHHGEHALGIARRFGDLDLTAPRPADGVVYFTVGPLFLRYPATWAVSLALLALVVGVVGGLRRRRGSTASVLGGLARSVGAGLLATVAGTLLWLLVTHLRTTPGVVESYVYGALVLALSAWVATKVLPRGGAPGPRATVPIWIVLSLLTALWLPGFSYLFAWPALAASIALGGPAAGGMQRALRFLLVAIPACLLLTPAIDFFFQMAQPRPGNPDSEMRAAVALPLLLALLVLGLLRTAWPRPVTEVAQRAHR